MDIFTAFVKQIKFIAVLIYSVVNRDTVRTLLALRMTTLCSGGGNAGCRCQYAGYPWFYWTF